MACIGMSRNGQIFEWQIDKLTDNGSYNSSEFEIFGTNSKWMLRIATSNNYEDYYLSVKLIKCQGNISEGHAFTVVAFMNRLVIPAMAEKTFSSPYKLVYDIYFSKRHTLFESIKITCAFYTPSFVSTNDILSCVSDDCVDSKKKRKFTEDDSSTKPSSSSLKSPLHLKTLSGDFNDMLQKNIMSDIELRCGEVSIPAHRAVLVSRSKVFASMFEHEMGESITGFIDITDIEPSALHEFLKYLYSGTISEDLSEEIILELYNASDKYEVQSLQEGCRNIFVRNLTEENCIEILTLAQKHCDDLLKGAVVNFIIERPGVLKSDAWISFSDSLPKLANTIYQKIVSNIF